MFIVGSHLLENPARYMDMDMDIDIDMDIAIDIDIGIGIDIVNSYPRKWR